MVIRYCLLVCLTVALSGTTVPADEVDYMVQLRVGGAFHEGQPLQWSKQSVTMLGRDGSLFSFPTADAANVRKSAPKFLGYSTSEIRPQLYREFGNDYEVTGTGHYLVVHPKGKRDQWARRFEQLYRWFYQYFRVRGFRLEEPEFPLIAVVFPTRQEFRAHAAKLGTRIPADTLGFYSPITNRIYLYDTTEGNSNVDWTLNADTIIHEATHQTAFNTGVHTRLAGCPRWVSEGLATLFEARGVYNSGKYTAQRDRYNRRRLADFREYAATRRREGSLADFLRSDDLFSEDAEGAYAEAWALSFFLSETRPQQYSEYLAETAARQRFQSYNAQERLADFQAVFGNNLICWKPNICDICYGFGREHSKT